MGRGGLAALLLFAFAGVCAGVVDGTVTTLAGSGAAGSANGIGTLATFNNPAYVAVNANATFAVVVRHPTLCGVRAFFAPNIVLSSCRAMCQITSSDTS